MVNLEDDDPCSPNQGQAVAVNARAKGLFAKSSEDEILIEFKYLFCDPCKSSELVIYLSDTPELLGHSDPLRDLHYIEVARLSHPPAGRPGSYDSGRFGFFNQEVSKEHLNFIRGTRIEFELIGPEGTCILIDNWDPVIRCSSKCMEVAGPNEHVIDTVDYLAVLSECGRFVRDVPISAGLYAGCVEGLFSQDWVVTPLDAASVLMAMAGDCVCTDVPCTTGVSSLGTSSLQLEQSSAASITGVRGCDGPLLVAGKAYYNSPEPSFLDDGLYAFDSTPNLVCEGQAAGNNQLNSKLIRDYQGNVYQLNLQEGLIPISGGSSVPVVPGSSYQDIASDPWHGQSATVYVGRQMDSQLQYPIQDAAFDRYGYVYVVPVLVAPSQAEPYMAAAKLKPGPSSTYSVERLYIPMDPQGQDDLGSEGLREIEVDDYNNVFILSRNLDVDPNTRQKLIEGDRILVYDGDSSTAEYRLYLDEPSHDSNCIYAPTAMHISNHTDGRLYITSLLSEPDAASTLLYAVQYSNYPANVETVEIPGLGHITDIAEDPVTGTVWAVGYSIAEIPQILDSPRPQDILDQPPFYAPYIAKISSDLQNVQVASAGSDVNLALPLSVVWMGTDPNAGTCWDSAECAGQSFGDATCDGSVNLADMFALKAHFGKCAPWTPPECCPDVTQDNCINLADLFTLKAGFGSSGYSPSTGSQNCP
jgi:hypothetical protein